jgi:hypothetical protein
MTGRTRAVEEVLDRLGETAEEEGRVSIDDVVSTLGDRGWGPFLFVPALIEISPIGAVPGIPTLLACIIAIFAVQIAWGRERMWLPRILGRRSVSGDRTGKAVEKLRPVGRWLDRWFGARLERFTGARYLRGAAIFILLLCLCVPPLELLPLASTAPMAAIATFGLAMTLRDGLLMALGYLFSIAAVAGGIAIWSSGG